MKKISLSIALMVFYISSIAQTIQLNTNGFLLKLKQVDNYYYEEQPVTGAARNNIQLNENTFKLKYSIGNIIKTKNQNRLQAPAFSSAFYAYEDGSLQAPTTQLFLKPVNTGAFMKKYAHLGAIEKHPAFDGFYYLYVSNKKYITGESIFSLCKELYENKDVSVVEPVFIRLIKQTNPLRPQQWNIMNNGVVPNSVAGADMGVEFAWNNNITGNGINVAVIDDGVDLTHPDLQANLLPGFDATGGNSGGAPQANNGHGTNCAGIIASVNNTIGTIGVAFNSRIIPLRMGTVAGGLFTTSAAWISNCFNEAVLRGADVISCSWSSTPPSAEINEAIRKAVTEGRGGRGCVVLFSAANDNNPAISYPASNENVIAVGASSPCDTRKRSGFDAEGVSCDNEGWWGSNFGPGLDVLAPGVLITTTDNVGANGIVGIGGGPDLSGNYNGIFNGTSAACPNAAAVIALILSANPNLTGQDARNILEQSCFKIPIYNFQANVAGQPNGTWNNQAGYGRVDVRAAMCRALGTAFAISGPDRICSSENYSINTNQNVTWSVNPAYVNLSPSGNQVNVTRVYDGSFTLTGLVNNGCGISVSRPIISGGSFIPSNYIIGGIPDGVTFCVGTRFNVYSTISPVSATNWSVLGGTIESGQGTQYIYVQLDNEPGGFAVMVQYLDDCGNVRTAQLSGTKVNNGCSGGGVETRMQTTHLDVYPNPVADLLNIQLPYNVDLRNLLINVYDIHGRTLIKQKVTSIKTQIPLANFAKGIYMIEVLEGRKRLFQKKVVKK